MSKTSIENLKNRYSSSTSKGNSKKELSISKMNKNAALGATGKPKNMKETIIRLFKYLSKERVVLIISLICVILQTIASLTASYLLRPIINKFIYYDGSSDLKSRISGLIIGLIFMAIVYAISIITQWLQQRLMLTVSQKALKKMRNDLMNKLQSLPISYFDKQSAGDIMSRFTNDVDAVGEMLSNTLIKIISGAITIIGSVILMLYTNLILGSITIISTPLLVYASKSIVKKSKGAFSEQQKNLGLMGGFVEETISGQKVVKVFNHEKIAMEEFDLINDELANSQIKAQFRSGIMGPVTHQLCNMIYAISSCVGGLLIVKKGFDIGGMAVSLNFTRRFNRPINEISMQMNVVMSSLAGAERVFELLDSEPEKEENETTKIDEIKGDVEINNVSFGYVPETIVLRNITLSAKQGQKIAFVGSTGAGKTTITNLLSRFYSIVSGTITIDGVSIEKIERSVLRSNIAMVLQDTHLFTGTIRENIRYGRLDATDEEVEIASKVASAHSFISKLPKGYDTILENDGANLSQGQRQLLNIARATISKAPILILDEATSSVDTRTEKHIEKGMVELMKNRTTFVIAHRLSTVRSADCIKVLEKGQIIESGTHEELLELKGRYYELYNELAELE
ncbi:MAG: ABC transporter ATP-binding protein [Clostridia bacterium]|nr:ABC transporter ATP-binding protein [Clostridia bacterium]